ncbi:MAG: HDOD domain-containing protein [Firmicutes bacterium]|nr:HDOD domain-containing protein [Bacillota bacterium]
MSNVILQVLARDLPELPAPMAGIVAQLRNPNLIDLEALIDKIKACGNLSDIVLRMVNTGYLRHGRIADNLDDAVLLVGVEAVRHTVLGVLLYSMFPKRKLVQNFSRENFLRHCLGTAIAAQMLLDAAGLGEQYDSYRLITYGLLHDIGIVALDRCLPVTLNRIFQMAAEEHMPILEAEVKVLGKLTHSVIGEWVCGKWNLPPDIRNVVQYHHAPRKAKGSREEVVLMHIADVISFNYYESLLESVHKYGMDVELVRSVGLTMSQISEVEEALPERVERAMQRLDVEALESFSFC